MGDDDDQELDTEDEFRQGAEDHHQQHLDEDIVQIGTGIFTGCFCQPTSGCTDAYRRGWESRRK